jgi:HAD superfamily hydrolase (TIGR01509 family)
MNPIPSATLANFKAAIFDLDNCLAAADEMGRSFYVPAFDAIREANDGTVSDAVLELALEDCWRHPLDFVAEHHGLSQAMLNAGWSVFSRLEVQTAMRGYGDLDVLKQLPVLLFLVTSGFRRLQESKIKALGIAPIFSAVYVDAIDEPDRKGKQEIFAEILERYGLKPEETLVIGDNPDSEIAAGNRLGMPTVQILRPGVPRGENAGQFIHELSELVTLMAKSRVDSR